MISKSPMSRHFDNVRVMEWRELSWLRDLFESHPEVLEIAARAEDGGRFEYKWCITVLFQVDEVRYRFLNSEMFNLISLGRILNELKSGSTPSTWLEHPLRSDTVLVNSVARATFGLTATAVPVDQLVRHQVLQENSGWMLKAVENYPQITHIGKRANTLVSPYTFMFRRGIEQGEDICTWMKEPTLEKLRGRMARLSSNSWKAYNEKEFEDCGWIFTRAEIFAFCSKEDRYLKMQQSVAAAQEEWKNHKCCICDAPAGDRYHYIEIAKYPALGKQHYCASCINMPSDVIAKKFAAKQKQERIAQGLEVEVKPVCAECGCSLNTNRGFGGANIGQVCGECQVSMAGDHAWEAAAMAARGPIYREPPPKKPSRFDSRPGIDDQGLGFYSPTWED